MYTNKEKTIILAGLFHDIGKFYQRCIDSREYHQNISAKIIGDFENNFCEVLGNSKESFEELKELVLKHHIKDTDKEEIKIIKTADHLSASQRVDFENEKELDNKWSHKFLSSIFSKVKLNNEEKTALRYYKHELLTKENYKALIPTFDNEIEAKTANYQYNAEIWKKFISDLGIILSSFNKEDDFDTLINLLLVMFEKYMWCLPDFTGSSETDISLFNHLKDTTAFAHSIYLTKSDNKTNNSLNLIIGDIPGIQNYIMDVLNNKAAKMLRGRSIFVQILSRIFASMFLEEFGLTECNLIMLAGGKFYILAPDVTDFKKRINSAKNKIEKYLGGNFNFELKFVHGSERFDYTDLLNEKISFGDIIEKANDKLVTAKSKIFKSILFDEFCEDKFILNNGFMQNIDSDSNNIKCCFTDKPILNGKNDVFEGNNVNKQSLCEYKIGESVVVNNTIVEMLDNFNVNPDKIFKLKNYKSVSANKKY